MTPEAAAMLALCALAGALLALVCLKAATSEETRIFDDKHRDRLIRQGRDLKVRTKRF